MARQSFNTGSTANDGTGDTLRDAFEKAESNFIELYEKNGWASYIDSTYTSGSPFTVSADTDTVLPNHTVSIVDSQKPSDIDEFYYSGSFTLSSVSGTFTDGETVTGGTSGATADLRIVGSDYYFTNQVGDFTTSETITGGTSSETATVDAVGDGFIVGRNGDSLDIMLYFKAEPSSVSQWMDVWIDIGGSIGELYRQTFSFPKGSGTERGVLYALPSAYTLNTWEANGGTIYVRSNASLDIYGINYNFDRTHKAI